jgi:hypothetical protein
LLAAFVVVLGGVADFLGGLTTLRGVVGVEGWFVAKPAAGVVVVVDFLAVFFVFFFVVVRFPTNNGVPRGDRTTLMPFDLPIGITLVPRVSGLAAEEVGAGESERRSGTSAR